MDILVQIIFGWPAIITCLLLALAGLVFKRPVLLLISAGIITPVSFYLSGYPAIRWAAFLLPFFQTGSALALKKKKTALAWLLVLPVFIASCGLAYLVLTQ